MDYDNKSDIAAVYDEARVLAPERLRQWQDLLSTQLDRTAISVVVDLGCGTGRFTEPLATLFQAKVIGVDPSVRMISKARQKFITDNVAFQQASAEALPLPGGAVDLVFMSQVYHHLAAPADAARECYRVLRHSGQVCVRNTTRENDFVYRDFFPLQALIESDLPTRKDMESVFVAAGFAVARHQTVTQFVSRNWPAFVHKSALRADSFLARLSDDEFYQGMAALRAHAVDVSRDDGVTEEIDWFVFTKPAPIAPHLEVMAPIPL
jgi:SAM-dependent methyltransferase